MKLDACRKKVDLRVIYAGLCSEGKAMLETKKPPENLEYFMNTSIIMILKKLPYTLLSKPNCIFACFQASSDLLCTHFKGYPFDIFYLRASVIFLIDF